MGERTPNQRLDALMDDYGISDTGLARRMREMSACDGGPPVGTQHTNIAKYRTGVTAQPGQRICEVMVAVLSQLTGRALTFDDIGFPDACTDKSDSSIRYPATTADSITELTRLTRHELQSPASRTRLEVFPAAWTDLLIKATLGADSPLSTWVDGCRLTQADVQLVLDTTQMLVTLDYRYGGAHPKPLVARFLEGSVLPRLAQVDARTPLGKEYFCAVARLALLAGWNAYDIGEQGMAQRYTYQAFCLTRAARDKALCGRILAAMSHQANYLGHFETAVHLARAAVHCARGHATPNAMALFHAMEARALASTGNQPDTLEALGEAERYMSSVCHPDDEPAWVKSFDRAELNAEFAHCYRDLGIGHLATRYALDSIAEADSSQYARSLLFVRTVLATSYLQSNDIEHALDTVHGVVDAAASMTSERVITYLDEFSRRLVQTCPPMHAQFLSRVAETIPLERLPRSSSLIAAP